MEEKRKDAGDQPTESSTAGDAAATPTKLLEAVPSAEPPSSRRRGGGQKRKAGGGNGGNASAPQTTSTKRQAREKASAAAHASIHNGPFTRARQSPGAASGASDGVVKSEAVPLELGSREAARAAEESSVKEDLEALEAKLEAEFEAIRSRDVSAHVVPIPAGWFSWTTVHPLEERTLPSFFNGKSQSRTPEIYMEIRNWIMRKFHANPNTQIELKDLSDLAVGDLDARQEVMEFLDHWGLINYHPFPETDSAMVNANAAAAAKIDSLIEKLYRFETEQSCAPVVPRTNVVTPAAPSGLFPESAVADDLGRPEGPAYHCNSCSADCSRKRYHCQKQADFDLCSECFNNGTFDSDMSPTDFIIMEPAEAAGVSGGKWTDQETLLLLEALELYKENWSEIAEHVATKTKAQCILHFIQMPIEDTFMDCDDEIDASHKEDADPAAANNDTSAPKEEPETTDKTGADETHSQSSPREISKPEDATELKVGKESNENCALKALNEAFEAVGFFPMPGGQFSFADAGNPVMALAAFLVRLVEPKATTALVSSSLKSISGNSSSMKLAARHSFLLHDPPCNKNKLDDSERAVAETVENDAQKNEKQNEESRTEEKSNLVLEGSDLPNDHDKERAKDNVRDECIEKSGHEIGTHEEGLVTSNKSDNPDLPKVLAARGAKESDNVTPKAESNQNSVKEPSDKTTDKLDKPDLLIDAEERSAKESDDLTAEEEIPSTSAKEPGDRTSVEGSSHSTEAAKNVVVDPDSLPSEKRNTGEKETRNYDNQKQDPSETKNYKNIDYVKRAAVTALSAAAVKAKLLADQEEDQIRHLATLLIEKQLHKLETKLAFFTEMESVMMRAREQMERSKQRLYQERAQIIASRLGYSAPTSRPTQQSFPVNRVAMGFANSAVRPPMSMTPQRPPVSRSSMTVVPSPFNTFVPAKSAGYPTRPTK